MRLRLGWVFLLGGLVACGGDDEGEDGANGGPAAAGSDSVVRQPVYAEAEAAEVFRVLNEGEVSTARIARERSQNADILRFASVMISDHQAMTQLLDSLLPPPADTTLRNADARRLRQETQQLVDTLQSIMGGFNNLYIEQQVRAHEQALLLLDTALIPSARTPQVKQLLTQLRPALAAHLQRARQIYTARMADPELATPAPAPRPAPVQPTPQSQQQPQTPRQPPQQEPAPRPAQTETVFPTPPVDPPSSTSNM